MCRYAATYKDHYACFDCHKAFKRRKSYEWPKHLQPVEGERPPAPCPECDQPMADMGLDFKAPRRRDARQWAKVEALFRHGFTYHSCGFCGPGLRPAELRQVEAFLQDHLPQSEGKQLLRTIEARVRTSKRRVKGTGV